MPNPRSTVLGVRHLRSLVACALVVATACSSGGPEPIRPELEIDNLLLITIDTLRADHVGSIGYERPTTPNMDRLGLRSAVFTQAIAQSSWTRASVASYMTGLYPTTIGLTCHNFRVPKADCDLLPQAATTLAEVLQGDGFRTIGIVANINVDAVFGFDQGYDEFASVAESLARDDPDWRLHADWFDATTREVTDQAIAWLDGREPQDGRFLLNLHYLDPHDPYEPPEPQRSAFDPGDYAVDPRVRELVALYDGEILHVDQELNRLFDRLETLGLAERTAIVILSDHGEEFHDHGGVRHGFTMFDEQIRVPLIVSVPGLTDGGRRIDRQVRLLDVMPTVLDVLDVRAPTALQGSSLLALLSGVDTDPEPALSEWGYSSLVSFRAPPWKLIYDIETETPALYNIETDPLERDDVAQNEPRVVARLTDRMTDVLSDALEAGRALDADTGEVQLSRAQIERLEALGYVD
jgi:arylsulfatase A-like enzyme